uniref:Uncharacterized protein n=1 Tax=viral metagenome TaxID=1070528 RepID=A0A6C0J2M0_9ZZZZ
MLRPLLILLLVGSVLSAPICLEPGPFTGVIVGTLVISCLAISYCCKGCKILEWDD